jgi:hypothetical protein
VADVFEIVKGEQVSWWFIFCAQEISVWKSSTPKLELAIFNFQQRLES